LKTSLGFATLGEIFKENFMRQKKVATRVIKVLLILIMFICRDGFGQSALKILISNDDGIDAPGLAALFDKLSSLGSVTVAAAVKNQSGVSHGLTSDGPIWVEETERKGKKWYAIEALPATCVRLALESLLPEKPDILVAGVNRGETTGVVTFYSATVACAREAAFNGIPAVAVHLERSETMDYEGAASFIAELIKDVLQTEPKSRLFLNINIPGLPKEKIKGVLITRQDTRKTIEFYAKKKDPSGKVYFERSFKRLDPAGEKTDIWAVRNGYISITPLQFDQTDDAALKSLEAWAAKKWGK
jgi:5'-nucleotidase